jgi:hypothetical protein
MPTWRTGLMAAAAAMVASAVAVAAAQGSGSAAPAAPKAASGIATLRAAVNLPPGMPGAWANIPLEVRLPGPGRYELDADVRGRLQGAPPVNIFITARLWNVTSGTEVAGSERLVNQTIYYNAGTALAGGNETAPISELVSVSDPTTIRLQALEYNDVGTATIAQVASDNWGYTTLRYVKVSP